MWLHIYFSYYFAKIKADSYNFLPIEKILTLHNFIIYMKSVNHKNHYYYKIFSENAHINYLKSNYRIFFCNAVMAKFGKTELEKD